MSEKDRKEIPVGSFGEAVPIVYWNNSVVEISPIGSDKEIQLTVGLYDRNDDRIVVRGVLFNYLPLPTWQDQLKALGFIRRVAQRRYNEVHGR